MCENENDKEKINCELNEIDLVHANVKNKSNNKLCPKKNSEDKKNNVLCRDNMTGGLFCTPTHDVKYK